MSKKFNTDATPEPGAAKAAAKAENPKVSKPGFGQKCVKITGHNVESVVPAIKSK